ncbi:MAG: ABC transporter permease [Propionibacteriaceae bacterium]
MTVEPTWWLALAIALLLLVTVLLNAWAKIGTAHDALIAALRAAIQLAAVSFIIAIVIKNIWLSLAMALVMFAVATWTTAKRTGTTSSLPWVAVAVLSGVIPVLAIVFSSRVVPFAGISIIPIAGIVIGNMMTAHTLLGRRVFSTLRSSVGTYEAGLSIGLPRSAAIHLITQPLMREALIPNLDQTRTVGLVTLPGAFIGVLLGGGSAIQASAAQLLVLVMIMCGQTIVVVVAEQLIRLGLIMPTDLRTKLIP